MKSSSNDGLMKPSANGATSLASGPPKTLTIEVMLVTPAMAKAWLAKNHPKNRNVGWRDVEALANDIRAGNWVLTHQGVCIGVEGMLVDGQHRLQAIVEAGVAVWMVVTHDPTATPENPYDRNRVRSLAQLLGKRGRDVSALNALRSFEQGYYLHTKMTKAEAEGIISRHWTGIEKILAVRGGHRLHGPILAACVWSLPCAQQKVLEFVEKVGTGEMIGRGNPAFAFRNWLERNKKCGPWEKALAALNAIRYYAQDLKMASVYTGDSGYRAVVAKRRVLRVYSTPGADLVQGVSWMPARGEQEQDQQ